MPSITVDTNLSLLAGETFQYRYQKLSTGTWSTWFTANTDPFTFTTSDPLNTNYLIEVYKVCSLTNVGMSSSFTTSFNPVCNITNVYNFTPSACNGGDNFHSVTFLINYTGMRNDLNVITSVFRIEIDGMIYFINPDNASGTQSVTINNINSINGSKSIDVSCISTN